MLTDGAMGWRRAARDGKNRERALWSGAEGAETLLRQADWSFLNQGVACGAPSPYTSRPFRPGSSRFVWSSGRSCTP